MFIKTLTVIGLFLSSTTYAANILLADKYYSEQKYQLAKKEYLAAAEIGNPHALYKLGAMYQKGRGVKQDTLNALLFFSLAADYQFHNAEQLVAKIYQRIPAEQQQQIKETVARLKAPFSSAKIAEAYFPQLNEAALANRVNFEGDAELETRYYADDFDYIEDSMMLESEMDLDGESEFDDMALMISTPKLPYLIVDIDINKDGSIRNITEVQKIGSANKLVEHFQLFPIKQPMYQEQPVAFISRARLGAAVYDKFTLSEKNSKMYMGILKKAKQLRNGKSLNDRFQYATMLMNFPWLAQEPGEAEQRLLELAQFGHPAAMYEYGLKLYREQNNIPTAIHWISEASKYGLSRAEFRLAKILQTSPWVQHDDRKALFWYESAMAKGSVAAAIRAIDIKLLSKDKSLYDLPKATAYLEAIADKHNRNPEFYFLLAFAEKDRKNRDFKLVVKNMETAIRMGSARNWDVSEWQDTLARLTTGSIYIHDE